MVKSVFDWIKNLRQFRFGRVAVAVAAGFVFLLSTACNPSSPSVSGTGSYQEGRANQTELYRPIEPAQGGMNKYSDTDPRRNVKGLGSQAKARVEEAERNIQKVQNPQEFAEEYRKGTPLGERVRNIVAPAADTAKDVSEDVKEGTQRGVRNLKQNTEQAKQGAQETFDDASQNAQQLGKDASYSAKRTADDLKDNLSNAREDAKQTAGQLKRDLSYNAKGIDNRVQALGDTTRQVGGQYPQSGTYEQRLSADRSGSSVRDTQAQKQGTPSLDAKDLVEEAKDTFSTATKNVGEFVRDTAADPQRAPNKTNDRAVDFQNR